MTRSTNTLRRTATTVALAGAAIFGTVALAPAASAAQPATPAAVDGSSYTVPGNGNGGPSYFLVTDNGRKPIFFCDADKPNKRQNNCQADPESAPDRF